MEKYQKAGSVDSTLCSTGHQPQAEREQSRHRCFPSYKLKQLCPHSLSQKGGETKTPLGLRSQEGGSPSPPPHPQSEKSSCFIKAELIRTVCSG